MQSISLPFKKGAIVVTFIVEAVDPVNTGTLVVPPEEEEVFRVLDLVGQEQADGLQRLFPSVDVIAKEKVVGLRRKPK